MKVLARCADALPVMVEVVLEHPDHVGVVLPNGQLATLLRSGKPTKDGWSLVPHEQAQAVIAHAERRAATAKRLQAARSQLRSLADVRLPEEHVEAFASDVDAMVSRWGAA